MVAVPPETPVTTPVNDPAVAIAVLLLLQCPPETPSLSVIDEPEQTTKLLPEIEVGSAFTVIILVLKHPELSSYVMVAVPAATPKTSPDTSPIDAMVESLLVHVPP